MAAKTYYRVLRYCGTPPLWRLIGSYVFLEDAKRTADLQQQAYPDSMVRVDDSVNNCVWRPQGELHDI